MSNPTRRTIAQLAREALDIQDGCNLSGLVHGWSRAVAELRPLLAELGIMGTDQINWYPINRLWASKLHDLTLMGLSDLDEYGRAHLACTRLAEGMSHSEMWKEVYADKNEITVAGDEE